MDTIQSPDGTPTKTYPAAGRSVLGLLFLLPALFCCLAQLLLPTLSTFLMSFQKVDVLGSKKEFVGLENYAGLFDYEMFWQATGFTLLTLLVRLLVVAIVPLLLAWAVAQFGARLRLGLRVLFMLPFALFAPVAIAVTWLMFLNPNNGFLPFEKSWAASPASARSTLLFIDALYLAGLAVSLGQMIYLPLWRRAAGTAQPTFREVSKPMLAVWAVGILGVIILSLSTFVLSFTLTRGGPVGSTNTLGLMMYQLGFVRFQMGPGASIASLILLVTLLLGIAAGLLVILTRLRLDLVDTKPASEEGSQPVSSKGNLVLPLLLVVFVLGVCLLGALPFGWLVPQAVGGNGSERLPQELSAGRLFVNSLTPPLISATLQIVIAYLAALGIGALRPLGKRSEWLLLLFSPWLFISTLPLSLVNFLRAREAHTLDSLAGSVSPLLLSVPALFVLTIFFAGRVSRRGTAAGGSTDAPDLFKQVILPSLPLTAVLWLVLAFVNGQDVLWSLLISSSPENYNVNLILLQLVGMFGADQKVLATAITSFILPVRLLFFVCLALFQVFYLDRLTLYSEE